jgi:hypothetical protein
MSMVLFRVTIRVKMIIILIHVGFLRCDLPLRGFASLRECSLSSFLRIDHSTPRVTVTLVCAFAPETVTEVIDNSSFSSRFSVSSVVMYLSLQADSSLTIHE